MSQDSASAVAPPAYIDVGNALPAPKECPSCLTKEKATEPFIEMKKDDGATQQVCKNCAVSRRDEYTTANWKYAPIVLDDVIYASLMKKSSPAKKGGKVITESK